LRLFLLIITALIFIFSGWSQVGELDLHGFVSQGFIKTNENNMFGESKDGSFEFNEFALNFRTNVSERLSVGLQLLARDLGTAGNNEFKIDWGFATYELKDNVKFRLGKFNTPFGLYNETRDIDLLRTTVMLPQSVYTENYRDQTSVTGVSVFGDLDFDSKGSLDWELFFGSINIDDDSWVNQDVFDLFARQQVTAMIANGVLVQGGLKLHELYSLGSMSSKVSDMKGFNLIWNTPIKGLRVGLSQWELFIRFVGDYKITPINLTQRVNAPVSLPKVRTYSLKYQKERWTYATEYNRRFTDFLGQGPRIFQMYYHQIGFRASDKWEYALTRDIYYGDEADKTSGIRQWQKSWVASTRYNVNDNWCIKLELHDVDGVSNLRDVENPDGYKRDWKAWMLKATYSF
jgi:hypothetical protein